MLVRGLVDQTKMYMIFLVYPEFQTLDNYRLSWQSTIPDNVWFSRVNT